jgi:hypothetical protein
MTRFHLITNDGPRAALLINCHMGNLPASIAVIDDPALISALPDGALCRAFWFGGADMLAAWEGLWAERKGRGGIFAIAEEDWQKILAWANSPRRVGPHTEFDASGQIVLPETMERAS